MHDTSDDLSREKAERSAIDWLSRQRERRATARAVARLNRLGLPASTEAGPKTLAGGLALAQALVGCAEIPDECSRCRRRLAPDEDDSCWLTFLVGDGLTTQCPGCLAGTQ